MRKLFFFQFILFLYLNGVAIASSGPLAEGFGAEAWLDKIHVVLSVIALVVFMTISLIYLILKQK
tara:strand:+ start:141 stop:335 length:195 start_codon:yes stop_codon:yes gene_type:complete